MQPQCIESSLRGTVGKRMVSVSKWRNGRSAWFQVEIDGSCGFQTSGGGTLDRLSALNFADGVLCGLRTAAEEP